MVDKKTELKNRDFCKVVSGTHKDKTGTIQDKNISKTGHKTITVLQNNGIRFKTLLKNVESALE